MNNNAQRKVIVWVKAARLRTLPLALASVGMGNVIHIGNPRFRVPVFLMSMLTTILLQILSNLANDLGDSEHGADHADRKGPERAVQAGWISRSSMKMAVLLFACMSFISGIILLTYSFHPEYHRSIPLLFAGISSIAAAWFYTNGKRPYGYMALGDAAVFLFFGLLGVLGSAWLQVQEFRVEFLFPALAIGFWSTAVMNLNNMRDVQSDLKAGKRTVPMMLGKNGSRFYQMMLVSGGIVSLGVFGFVCATHWVYFSIPGILMMFPGLFRVFNESESQRLDSLLRPQALGTFLAVLGMILARTFLW